MVGWTAAIAAVAVAGWFGVQAASVRSSLNEAASFAEVLQEKLVAGDSDGARDALTRLQASAADARDTSDGVLWRAGSTIPWLGRNFDAVRTVSRELDRSAELAIPPIVDVADDLGAQAFAPANGRVDLEAFETVGPGLTAAAESLEQSRQALAQIESGSLLVPLRAPIATVQAKIETAASVSRNADLAARVLPDALGADGGRRYLLLVQNNAESRSLGGIVGSFSVIEARNGRISMEEQGNASDFIDQFDDPVAELRADEQAVFPSTMASDLRNVVITPHYPRAASIAAGMFEEQFDDRVDGVISIDPVALSYVLSGTGPVDGPNDVVIDASTVVPALLHQTYVYLTDPAQQDAFFEGATRAIFDRFTAGAGDSTTALRGLIRGVEENRVMFWSARDEIQELVRPTDLSGAYRSDTDAPRVGVFINDAASTKMEYFLNQSTSARPENCLDGGRQVIAMTTELTSTAPDDLPETVTGDGRFVDRGSMRLNVRLMSPTGGRFTSVRVDGDPVTVLADRWTDRNVTRVEIVLAPGESRTITANATSGADQRGDVVVTTTPGVSSVRNDFTATSSCTDD